METIVVMSGKGGVGKTTIAVNLAVMLTEMGYKVGLMDADIHGPNVPEMLGQTKAQLIQEEKKILPLKVSDNMEMISIAFFTDPSKSVIWRGPMKHNLLRQFVQDVSWSDNDYLVVDLAPGTGDESISIIQLSQDIKGAIIISTPQKVSIADSIRSIDFCNSMEVPILGLVENMSGSVFGKDTIKDVSAQHQIPFLGAIPLEDAIVQSAESGKPFIKQASYAGEVMESIAKQVIK
ncbi:MAG: Mrp/NBP35 family ATP-binding protein [Nanobdellota archaeon]